MEPSSNKCLCSIDVEGSVYFLSTFVGAGDGGETDFTVALLDAATLDVWMGSFGGDIKSKAKVIDMKEAEFIDLSKKALTRQNMGGLEFEYQVSSNKQGGRELSWKKVVSSIKLQLGTVNLAPVASPPEVVKDILLHSIQTVADTKDALYRLKTENDRLSSERTHALKPNVGTLRSSLTSTDRRVSPPVFRDLATALNDADLFGLGIQDASNLAEMLHYFGEPAPEPDLDDESEDDDESDMAENYAPMDVYMYTESGNKLEHVVEDACDQHTDAPLVIPDPAQEILSREGTYDLTSPDNDEELEKIISFSKCTCPRNKDKNDPCLNEFDPQYVLRLRAQMTDSNLTDREKKMFLMGKTSTSINRGGYTRCSNRARQKERQRSRVTYFVDGVKICRETFRFMHGIGEYLLSRIINHYVSHGVVPLTKNLSGRKYSRRALSHKDTTQIVNFIINYAEVHGIVLPGKLRSTNCSDPRARLLPSRDTRKGLWKKYEAVMQVLNERRMCVGEPPYRIPKRATFAKVWSMYCPFVRTSKPETDLCWQCQSNNSSVYQSANATEEEKMKRLQKQHGHLHAVADETKLYRGMVKDAKKTAGKRKLGLNEPCTLHGTMHYSFDYAQQLHFPNNPVQPGPMYLLCPRKCGIFGVNCEGTSQQVNYLVDEGQAISEGSNAVISYLDDFFLHYGLGERHVQLHCDNAARQNKNVYLLWYLCWRTFHELHKDVDLTFMVAAHTKFAPDACFGLIKQSYQRSVVSCLDDISDVVKKSSTGGINIPCIVGCETGDVQVPTYDWQSFLGPYFRLFHGIEKFHHFRFTSTKPGVVFVKVLPDEAEQEFLLLRHPDVHPPAEWPVPLQPPGISPARAQYLSQHIRAYCAANKRDVTCPLPPRPPSEPGDDGHDELAPAPKRLCIT